MSFSDMPKLSYRQFSDQIHRKLATDRVPTDGVIELTLRCNLSCAHCYCSYDSASKEMSYKEICRILDEIAEAGCLWLLITGGEPLIRPDFLDIYAYAVKKGMLILLFTNGTLITPAIADYLKEYTPFRVEITLYGMTQETYEKTTGVAGSFQRCMNGIRLLHERKLPLKLKSMVTTLNKHELFRMKEYAKSLGVGFRFDPILHPKLDGSKGPYNFRLSAQEVLELDLADEERRKDWLEFCEKAWEMPLYPERLFECSGGQDSFHIDPYGKLRLCDMVRELNYDLRNGSFKEGWYDFIPKLLSLKHSSGYKCKDCQIIPICSQCPGWAFLEHNDLEEPVDHLCQIAHLRAAAFEMVKK